MSGRSPLEERKSNAGRRWTSDRCASAAATHSTNRRLSCAGPARRSGVGRSAPATRGSEAARRPGRRSRSRRTAKAPWSGKSPLGEQRSNAGRRWTSGSLPPPPPPTPPISDCRVPDLIRRTWSRQSKRRLARAQLRLGQPHLIRNPIQRPGTVLRQVPLLPGAAVKVRVERSTSGSLLRSQSGQSLPSP